LLWTDNVGYFLAWLILLKRLWVKGIDFKRRTKRSIIKFAYVVKSIVLIGRADVIEPPG
jgi:hypothetical protein